MPEIILPVSFISLLLEMKPQFNKGTFESFLIMVSGFVHSLSRHRISDAIRAAGAATIKHYSCFYRFFSRANWSLDGVGLTLLGMIIRVFDLKEVELVVDDTLTKRSGKKVAFAGMHHDPLLSTPGRPFCSYGHVFVVLSVFVSSPLIALTGWALPVLFRLFLSSRQGGRDTSASDKRREAVRRRKMVAKRKRVRKTDIEVVDGLLVGCEPKADTGPISEADRKNKLELAAALVLLVARRFPTTRFRVLADHLYCGEKLLHVTLSQVDNVHFIVRGRPDAALFTLPPKAEPGRRGRPRVKGDRLPTPEQYAADHEAEFQRAQVTLYGDHVEAYLLSYVGMAYRTLPGRLIRYLIVKDPQGIYKPDYFLCTDTALSNEVMVTSFSRRWPLEQAFEDCKQKLVIEDPQVQVPKSVRRVVPFGMIIYSLVVLWYVLDGHRQWAKYAPEPDPWYTTKRRPSFSDMIATLRRHSWAEPFLDPASGRVTKRKILADYMARVVSVA
jgi:hypothetical protein